jgi:hypothetical protein
MINLCGGVAPVQQLLLSWHSGLGSFIASAYDFFRYKTDLVQWTSVVWEQWSLPRHSFSLWLAMLGKLRTRDWLQFLSSDSTCPLCQNVNESHAHLFFNCDWSSSLWSKARLWLKLHSNMPSLNKVIRVLHNNKKGCSREWEEYLLIFLCIWFGKKETGAFLITLQNQLGLSSGNSSYCSTLFCISMKKIT